MAMIFGYDFKNDELLATALTTPSYRQDFPKAKDNQRLEFLGDAVLGMLAADDLYRKCPSEQEGELTIRRAHAVSTASLCDAAWETGLKDLLRRNRLSGDLPKSSKTFADAIEAIIGAAYLDGGFEAAKTIFHNLGLDARAEDDSWAQNPKGDLQCIVQAMTPPRHPQYELIETKGPPHDPTFTVKVTVEGVGMAVASGKVRKEAEVAAAAKLLAKLKR